MILTGQIRAETTGRLGRITLDRPAAINALTQSMIDEIDSALDRFLADPEVMTVVLDGAGERGFCAGGDVVALRDSGLADGEAARRFWRTEYRLNARIAAFPKPVVAAMDGIVMGGGVGLAGHARHRIATERLVWAMPEVRIGFAPDVGGTYLLSRLPGELGTWIALTARRLDAREARVLGLVDRVVPRDELDGLIARLAVEDVDAVLEGGRGTKDDEVLGGDDAELDGEEAAPPTFPEAERGRIDEWFAGDDGAEIEQRLDAAGPAARPVLEELRRGSPTSVAVTLAALRRAGHLADLRECLEAEFRTSASLLETGDFDDGIRAALVDKDGAPRWDPDSIDEVDPGQVERILAGPPGLEALWDEDDQEGAGTWTST